MEVFDLLFYFILGATFVLALREIRFYLVARSKITLNQVQYERAKSEEVKIETLLDNVPLMLQNQQRLRDEAAKRGATDLQLKPIDDQIAFLNQVQKYSSWIRPFSPALNRIVNKFPQLVERLIDIV